MPKKKNPCRSGCPIAGALDVLGDRWTLLVLRDLIFLGYHEFGQFHGADEGIATNILTERLDRLIGAGLVERFDHPTDGKKYTYFATEAGLDLVPTLIELVLWGVKHRPGVIVPPERLRPLKTNPAAFAAQLRQVRLVELKSARRAAPR